jgi:hypothetical protein
MYNNPIKVLASLVLYSYFHQTAPDAPPFAFQLPEAEAKGWSNLSQTGGIVKLSKLPIRVSGVGGFMFTDTQFWGCLVSRFRGKAIEEACFLR